VNPEDMTRSDFEKLPLRTWDDMSVVFDSLVILPRRKLHDSGYRCMDFVAVNGTEAVCRLSGCSDVIHINGIGGFGKFSGHIPSLMPVIAWSIDCFKKSGLLRMWASGYTLSCGPALSSFELYADKKKES
jgi:hypothetical protein